MPSIPSLSAPVRRAGFFVSIAAALLVTLVVLAGFTNSSGTFTLPFDDHVPLKDHITGDEVTEDQSSLLAQLALDKVLQDAAPVFGVSTNTQSDTARWMKAYDDQTLIVHMNIPGTHDSASWNYSRATQKSLEHVTHLVHNSEADPGGFRTQDESLAYMLDSGIRLFDLRYAYDVTNSTLVFWHGSALFSETATVDDVLFGFYRWLDDHPSEALFLSFMYEGSTTQYATNTVGVQKALYNALTTPAAKRYLLQAQGSLGTLGEARGKITLLRRFDLDLLPTSYTDALPGLLFSPNDWIINGHNTTLVYNPSTDATAYIQDYYFPQTSSDSSAQESIQWKLNATEAHLRRAAETHPDSLFWSFASSTNPGHSPPIIPRIQALGNGTLTPAGGVNEQLVSILKSLKGKRLGWLMMDFFEQPVDLLALYLSLLSPEEALQYGA